MSKRKVAIHLIIACLIIGLAIGLIPGVPAKAIILWEWDDELKQRVYKDNDLNTFEYVYNDELSSYEQNIGEIESSPLINIGEIEKANDGIAIPNAAFIYFGTYDHLADMGKPREAYSGTSYAADDIKREGFASPILWAVSEIDDENGKISLASVYVLDTHVFNQSARSGNDYRNSDIRKWLNDGFIANAFAIYEAAAIIGTDAEIKLFDFYGIGANEVADATSPRVAYGDKVYLPDCMVDYASVYQKNDALNVGAMTWTRTWTNATHSANGDHAISYAPHYPGTATVTTNRGVAPLTAINGSSILFISEISNTISINKTNADDDLYRMPFDKVNNQNYIQSTYAGDTAYNYGAIVPAMYYKLTLLNPSIELTAILREEGNLYNGDATPLAPGAAMSLIGTASGNDKLAYKIVKDENGERSIIGYGMGNGNVLEVEAKDYDGNDLVIGGDYTLYVWAQKDSAINCHEGSEPMYFKLNISNDTYVPISTMPSSASLPDEIKVILNGAILSFDQQPIIQNGRTLVPLRAIFEALGADVQWEQSTQTVTAVRGNITVSFTIGSNILIKNGEQITLDVSAQIVGGRTLVPARAVAESFGADVKWLESTREVVITE